MLFIRVVDQILNGENVVIYMTAWDCSQLFWWNNFTERRQQSVGNDFSDYFIINT